MGRRGRRSVVLWGWFEEKHFYGQDFPLPLPGQSVKTKNLFYGFRGAPPVATALCPVWGSFETSGFPLGSVSILVIILNLWSPNDAIIINIHEKGRKGTTMWVETEQRWTILKRCRIR